MVLFTKVYGELSLRIQQSLPRCNNPGAFQAHAGDRALRSGSPDRAMRNESTLAGYTNLGYYRGETRAEIEKIINKSVSFR